MAESSADETGAEWDWVNWNWQSAAADDVLEEIGKECCADYEQVDKPAPELPEGKTFTVAAQQPDNDNELELTADDVTKLTNLLRALVDVLRA